MPNAAPHTPSDSAPPSAWRWYRPLIWSFAVATTTAWWLGSQSLDARSWMIVATLVGIGWVADLAAVRIQEGMRVSAAHFAAPFAIIAAGVPGALVAAAGCLIGRALWNRRDWNSFDVAVNLTATSVAGATWQLCLLLPGSSVVLPAILTVTTFSATRSLVNLGWSEEARSRGFLIPSVTVKIGRLMLAAGLLFTPSIALLHAELTSPFNSFVLLALPFVATQFLFHSFGRERRLNAELESANISITQSLVTALDARDPYSAGHSIAVAIYSRDLATEIGLSIADVQRAYLSGLLHDIGKIAVPDAILRKPGALTDEEFAEIRLHPVVGEEILRPSTHLRDILPGVRHHHERIDGKGYPDRLRDTEIPLQARILAIADAYNAMTSERPYREAMQPELAERILVQNQGMQHDPFLVAAFRRVLARHDDGYRTALAPEFVTAVRLHELMRSRVDMAATAGELHAAAQRRDRAGRQAA